MSKQSAVPKFSPEVEKQHVRLDADEYENVYVVGDVHGCYDELERLLRSLSPSEDDMLVFVGDLVNKGPNSDAVVRKVRSMENAVSVTGNNEQKILEGRKTADMGKENREYLRSLPVAVSWEGSLAVHGGVVPGKHLRAHSPDDLRETRSLYGEGYEGTFWFERYDGNVRVFFGHTVLNAPLDLGNAVGLDTGCVYGGSLTAYDCNEDEFVTVESKDTYRARSRHHIVSTGNL